MDDRPADAYLVELLSTPEGRRRMLSISVDAEEGDEGGVFDRLAEVVDEPELRRVVLRHRDDEARHAALFRGCLARLGMDKEEMPDQLRVIRAMGGGSGASRIGSAEAIVRMYAVLLAIEERGVERFPRIAEAFRPHDPETADVYLRVTRDERGHVRYCHRIGRHYAASDKAWQEAVASARSLEETVFAHVSAASVADAEGRGLVGGESPTSV
jgi:rubrerythrin